MSEPFKITVKDWKHVAQVAGKHGVRFPTNWRLEAFLTEIQSALEVKGPSTDGEQKPSVRTPEGTRS